ncbi:MAG: hypothetical protein K6T73_03410 [Candidatus Bathyarchaeota archaeon]|nr:hypothetical protein [Candidatus Bathyarchaeota archaeon]
MSRRLQFQKQFSIPPILNIGSGEDPAHFGEEAVHLDLDKWKHMFSVQADAPHLPFKDDSFRTVVTLNSRRGLVSFKQFPPTDESTMKEPTLHL